MLSSRSMGKPIKPPHCGYGLFCKYGLTKKKTMADLGPKWKKLSPQKKASYNLKATEVTLFEEIECDENYKKNLYFYRCTTRTTRNWPLTILTFQS